MTGPFRARTIALMAAMCGFLPAHAFAADATCLAPSGSLITRVKLLEPWTPIEEGAKVPYGQLVLALPDSTVKSANKSVTLTSRADYTGTSPLPILETAYTLQEPAKNFDLDIKLDRGSVELLNTKSSGTSKVQLRFLDKVWAIDLDEPGSRVTVSIYGRWPSGTVFRPNNKNAPLTQLVILVTDKSATLETPWHVHHMAEPPGRALFAWDSQDEDEPQQPIRLTKLPDWADPDAPMNARTKKAMAMLNEFRKLRLQVGVDKAIDVFFNSGDMVKERIALISMGAQDEMDRLAHALRETKSFEIWDKGAIVVRHWLGRGPGYDHLLYEYLTTKGMHKPIQARVIMTLLMGFDSDAVQTPELYELLIEYLRSEDRAIRNLAAWHLYRLVPSMKEKVPYQPNGSTEDFAKLHDAWKEAIPTGKLPPDIAPESDPKPLPKSDTP